VDVFMSRGTRVKFLQSIHTNSFITMHHYFCIFVGSECPTIGKSSRGKGLTMQPTVSYKIIWHSNGKAGTKGQEQSESSLNTSSILVSKSDSRSETNANNSEKKTRRHHPPWHSQESH
jgi:hypothetical protein